MSGTPLPQRRSAKLGLAVSELIAPLLVRLALVVVILSPARGWARNSEPEAGAHHAAPPVNWIDFQYGSKNVHGQPRQQGDAPMVPPFVLAILNFAIFAGLLYKFALPPIVRHFNAKHETIKTALAEAARLRAEAAAKLELYNQRVKDVDREVNDVITQLRNDAEAERKRILAEAQAQALRTEKEAAVRIEAEIAAAKRLLAREVAIAATEAARGLLKAKSTSADHTGLVETFLADLKAVADEGRS